MPFDSLPVLDEVNLTLRNARGILESGWCKGQLSRNRHQEHCAIGAIRMALGWKRPNALFHRTVHRLAESLPEDFRKRFQDDDHDTVTSWNDFHTRTHKQVLAQFDRVIRKYESSYKKHQGL